PYVLFFSLYSPTPHLLSFLHDALPISVLPPICGAAAPRGSYPPLPSSPPLRSRRQFRRAAADHIPRVSARRWSRPASLRRRSLQDRKSTRLNSSHGSISYAVFCLKKKK